MYEFQHSVVAHSFHGDPQVSRVSFLLCGLHQVQLHEALSCQLILPHIKVFCSPNKQNTTNECLKIILYHFPHTHLHTTPVCHGEMMTFANQPGILIAFLSTGAQLKKVVLLQTDQAISINVYDVKYVRQRLPVATRATRPYPFLVIG